MLKLFDKHEIEIQQMAIEFLKIPDSIGLSHQELADVSQYTSENWKWFLRDPRVSDYITDELRLIRQAKLRRITMNIDENSKSTGLPQILKELREAGSLDQKADGPIFVYCYIPLNDSELGADNIEIVKEDPFKVLIPD